MDKLLYYRELEREQQALKRSIQKRSMRIEELVEDIASLKEILDKYRASKEWLNNERSKEDKFDPDLETQNLLSCNEASDVIQALKLKKLNLSASTNKLSIKENK